MSAVGDDDVAKRALTMRRREKERREREGLPESRAEIGLDEDESEREGIVVENEGSFAVPTAGAFYMHDDRFRNTSLGRNRINSIKMLLIFSYVRKETIGSLAVSVKPKDWKKDFVSDGCFSRIYRGFICSNKIEKYAEIHVFNWANKSVSEVIRGKMVLLPNDIQEHIMFRLPVKALMRFKCVCKFWYDIISGDNFRRRYRSLQQANGNAPIGFICGDKDDFITSFYGFCLPDQFMYTSEIDVLKEELDCLDYLKTFGYVIAASKGLLLVGHDLSTLSVYDLVSKKLVNLPIHNLERGFLLPLGFKCKESSSSNPHLCYKVVCVDSPSQHHREKRSSYNVEIYSSETGVWQRSIMKSELLPFKIWIQHIAKVIRGVFYWHERYSHSCIAYDCEDPKGRVVFIELPDIRDLLYRKTVRQLEGRKDGSLQFICKNENVLKVWILPSTSE